MTAHVVKLTAETYPITSASWTMSLNGGSAQGPGNGHPYPVIHGSQSDTITFTVVPNPHGVTFASIAFCAVSGSSKPTPTQACSTEFTQSGNPHLLKVTDNGSAGEYYYVVKFNKDAKGNDVGPLDPIIIHERPQGLGSTATIIEVAAVAVVLVLVALFAWRRLRT